VTYWTISQERLLISGRTKRRWKALFISFLLTPSSSDSARSFWRSMLSCNLLLLPFSVSDSRQLVYACCPSRLIGILIYSLNACDRSDIHAIWSRIGGDTRGAQSRGNRDISDNISGRACRIRSNRAATVSPIYWLFNNIQFIQFSVLVGEIYTVL
jgi:hypothetical protein